MRPAVLQRRNVVNLCRQRTTPPSAALQVELQEPGTHQPPFAVIPPMGRRNSSSVVSRGGYHQEPHQRRVHLRRSSLVPPGGLISRRIYGFATSAFHGHLSSCDHCDHCDRLVPVSEFSLYIPLVFLLVFVIFIEKSGNRPKSVTSVTLSVPRRQSASLPCCETFRTLDR